MQKFKDTRTMIRYLLGDMPEAEKIRMEAEYFQDNEAFNHLLSLEDELMYDYLQGALAPGDRKKFEERYLESASGRSKARFAAALIRKIHATAQTAASALPWKKIIFRLAAAAVVIATFTWLILHVLHLRNEMNRVLFLYAALEENAKDKTNRTQSPGTENPVAPVFLLSPGTTRSAEGARLLLIPLNAGSVQLHLELNNMAHGTYRVKVSNAEDLEVWSQNVDLLKTESTGTVVVLALPAGILTTDDYEILLYGRTENNDFEEVASYHFTVLRR